MAYRLENKSMLRDLCKAFLHIILVAFGFYWIIKSEDHNRGWEIIAIVAAPGVINRYFINISKPRLKDLLAISERKPAIFFRPYESDTEVVFDIALSNELTKAYFGEASKGNFEIWIGNSVFKHIGPMISFASGKEIGFSENSYKYTIPNCAWRQVLCSLIPKSSVIILLAGATVGLMWELRKVRKTVSPHCLFIVSLPTQTTPDSRLTWGEIRNTAKECEIELPKLDPGSGVVLSFNEDWSCIILRTHARTPEDYTLSIRGFWVNRSIQLLTSESAKHSANINSTL